VVQRKVLADFLRFVVERHLDGKDDELKETLLAIEVFGRKPDYDPKQDSIVRTEAGPLRSKLIEYYSGEGRNDSVIIELPKGRYTPVFRITDVAVADHQRSLRSRWSPNRVSNPGSCNCSHRLLVGGPQEFADRHCCSAAEESKS